MAWLLRKPPLPCHRGGEPSGWGGVWGSLLIYTHIIIYVYIPMICNILYKIKHICMYPAFFLKKCLAAPCRSLPISWIGSIVPWQYWQQEPQFKKNVELFAGGMHGIHESIGGRYPLEISRNHFLMMSSWFFPWISTTGTEATVSGGF